MSSPTTTEQQQRKLASQLKAIAVEKTRWQLDPRSSTVSFQLRRRIGYGIVRGRFDEVTGELEFENNELHGHFSIATNTLDSGRTRRNRRISSTMLGGIDHPTIDVTVERGVLSKTGAFALSGSIAIAGRVLPLHCSARLVDLDEVHNDATVEVELSLARSGIDHRMTAVASKYVLGSARLHVVRSPVHELAHPRHAMGRAARSRPGRDPRKLDMLLSALGPALHGPPKATASVGDGHVATRSIKTFTQPTVNEGDAPCTLSEFDKDSTKGVAMDPEQVPVTTFDPLLRDLLYWGLLVRVDDADGQHWQLAERAERRLDEFAAESRAFAVEHMVFLDHRCGVCGFRRLTRLRDSRYVCDECWSKADQPIAEPNEVSPNERP